MTAAVSTPATPAASTATALSAEGAAAAAESVAGAPTDGAEETAAVEGAVVEGETPAADDAAAEPPPAKKPGELARETVQRARKAAAIRRQREEAAGLQRERASAAQLQAQLAETRAELARQRAAAEEAAKDPLAYAKKAGLTAKQLIERSLAEGTPEAKIAALEAQLREQAEESRTWREQQQRAEAAREQRARTEAAIATFHQTIDGTAEEPTAFPLLAALPRSYREAICQATFAEAQRKGYTPTDEEVLEYVETTLAAPKKPPATPSRSAPAAKTGTPPVAKKATAPPSKTVTSKLQTAQFVPPKNWDELDDQTQNRMLAAWYSKIAK